MALLVFHLVMSSYTFEGVDIEMAQKILDYQIQRYPNGVFFLFGQGRLHLCRGQPAPALEYYRKAMEAQSQYRNLHHLSYWDMACANLALWEIPDSLDCWRNLAAEATVSSNFRIRLPILTSFSGRGRHTRTAPRHASCNSGRNTMMRQRR